MRPTRDLSDRHEDYLAELIEGRRTPGSGNGFANQADVRNDHRRQSWAFALDGKSTLGRTITIGLERDWHKIVEQAHDEIPGLGLRWYANESLRQHTDLVVIGAPVFGEMVATLREHGL